MTGRVSELVEGVIGASSAWQARESSPRSGRREACSALADCWVVGSGGGWGRLGQQSRDSWRMRAQPPRKKAPKLGLSSLGG